MAAYFHGSNEIQAEGMQTLYLMNPNFAGYSDPHAAHPSSNMILLNSTNPIPHSHPHPQHLVGIPVQSTQASGRPSSVIHYDNLWTQQRLSLSLPVPDVAAREAGRNEEVKFLGSQSALINSRFLRLAQQLLDEVVSVWKESGDKNQVKPKDGEHEQVGKGSEHEDGKQSAELSTAEKQELQMKKAKLINMLDEVGQRYKQYRQQMQLVVSSFEAAAGAGSAKAYTALALKTISRQFRCLRDAITGQIRVATKGLGEEEEFTEGGVRWKGSRLQFIDQQVRQQRALQQLGMIHHNAWRPQRGLPERAVSVLRAWLFEHFLHPYPKDSDKQLLAKQTGLTRSQVSNWFINARVRLWKPMVEEMYKEEMKEQEQSNADEKTSDAEDNNVSSTKSPTRTDQAYPQVNDYDHASYGADDELLMQTKLKKARTEELMIREDDNHGYSSITGHGFGEYSVGEIERFGLEQFAPRFSGNNVSLTLGLTQYGNLSLSGAQPSYIESNGFSGLGNNPNIIHPANGYDNISIESRKRFAAQLLPDFVA